MLSEYDDGMQSAAAGSGQGNQPSIGRHDAYRRRICRRREPPAVQMLGAEGVAVERAPQAGVVRADR